MRNPSKNMRQRTSTSSARHRARQAAPKGAGVQPAPSPAMGMQGSPAMGAPPGIAKTGGMVNPNKSAVVTPMRKMGGSTGGSWSRNK